MKWEILEYKADTKQKYIRQPTVKLFHSEHNFTMDTTNRLRELEQKFGSLTSEYFKYVSQTSSEKDRSIREKFTLLHTARSQLRVYLDNLLDEIDSIPSSNFDTRVATWRRELVNDVLGVMSCVDT